MKAVLVIVALVSTLVMGQKEGRVWCSIEPLVTTRAEVEALLGPPTSGTGYILSFDTNDEHITMWFGGAKTDKADPCKWKVEKNTVFGTAVTMWRWDESVAQKTRERKQGNVRRNQNRRSGRTSPGL